MAILDENRDVYMINPCKANISFVVELCEMVSVRTIEIACFELFSSIPKKFKVYTSERLALNILHTVRVGTFFFMFIKSWLFEALYGLDFSLEIIFMVLCTKITICFDMLTCTM